MQGGVRERIPSSLEQNRSNCPSGLAVVPGTTVTCFLLTALVVLQAITPPDVAIGQWLLCLYLAALYACFATIRRRNPGLRPLPFRLLEWGFLVLTSGFAVGAVLRTVPSFLAAATADGVEAVLQQGPGLLLGVSLISYGVVLLIGEQLQRHAELAAVYAHTRNELHDTEVAHQLARRRLEEANALKAIGELAAGVAHDLRNPLTVVRAAVDDLAERPRSGTELDEHFDVIRRNLGRVERTIQGLLDAGRVRPAPAGVEALASILADVAELARRDAVTQGVVLEFDVAASVRVSGDAEALTRALTNLVINAVQASPQGCAVRVRGRVARLHRDHRVTIAIDDRGPGVDGRARERLFRPFFSTKPDGTGLGLVSAQRLLASQGGDVRLYPRRRGGTRALVTIPCAPDSVASAP